MKNGLKLNELRKFVKNEGRKQGGVKDFEILPTTDYDFKDYIFFQGRCRDLFESGDFKDFWKNTGFGFRRLRRFPTFLEIL